MFRLGLLCVAILSLCPLREAADCPCEQDEWCEPITGTPDKEVVGFVLRSENWKGYNWTHLTTLMVFGNLPAELMCFAHEKGVRVVLGGLNGFGIANLSNSSARSSWISSQLQKVQSSFADGINLDIEEPVKNGSSEQTLLTQFVGEVYTAFKKANKDYQVTYDVAWSPNCTDGRCYEVVKFADVTDFMVVMSYDEQSQIFGPCIAYANSPLSKTEKGVQQYLDLGIDPSKLVLGQPWYGYNYPCVDYNPNDDTCTIKEVPFRGVACSDAAGKEYNYNWLRKLIRASNAVVKWNETYQAPYFQEKFSGGVHQYWFDNPKSLSLKYAMARDKDLKGLAFWNVDALDYSGSDEGAQDTAEMWSAIDTFFNKTNKHF